MHAFNLFRGSSAVPRAGRALLAFACAATLALAGCGGGGSPSEDASGGDTPTLPPVTPPTTPPVTPPASSASGALAGVPIDHAAFGGAMTAAEVEAASGRLTTFVAAWKTARTDLPR